jgi:hypothetical protein
LAIEQKGSARRDVAMSNFALKSARYWAEQTVLGSVAKLRAVVVLYTAIIVIPRPAHANAAEQFAGSKSGPCLQCQSMKMMQASAPPSASKAFIL